MNLIKGRNTIPEEQQKIQSAKKKSPALVLVIEFLLRKNNEDKQYRV